MATTLLKEYVQTVTTNASGSAILGDSLDLRPYQKVSLQFVFNGNVSPLPTLHVVMGKLSGSTLGAEIASFKLSNSGTIHTYEVVGPELGLNLTGGPANTAISLQGWVFLH